MMAIRRFPSVTVKRWILAFFVLVVIFASVAYVQFDARKYGMGSDSLVQNDALLRNEIEEIGSERFVEIRGAGKKVKPVPPLMVDPPLAVPGRREEHGGPSEVCPIRAANPHKATFDVSQMTYSLKMDDLNWDGDVGVWDPQMEKLFEEEKKLNTTRKRKLKVFVVPFSHSDPGWLMTVDQYLQVYTKNTLDLVLQRLQEWPDMTFIWAEVSFFELWWSTLDDKKKNQVRELIAKGRLEIVNGGYVMPDEASTHYYAILHQYIYGHQWLQQHLNVTPRHGFSIDPFGYSSTMPYILKNLGLESMFIQRIHYVIRKRLVQAKASQFSWQQPWDAANSEGMFTYMSHATLYDIKHTCGQNNEICLQFDYQYGPPLDKASLQAPALQLLQQFRKTSLFYPHDVILFPIGMDFRWTSNAEWEAKHANFRNIMDLLNGDPKNDVEVKFGTYDDYYRAVFGQMGVPQKWSNLPSLTGDFFPYADRTVEYWTGYFTSRPFQKALGRDLESHLRTAEILFVLARIRRLDLDSGKLLSTMESAAKSLGLFQHHDAITGTSKQAVSEDYERRLFTGLSDVYDVIQYTTSSLLWPNDTSREALVLHNTRSEQEFLPSKKMILLVKDRANAKQLVVVNSLAATRFSAVDVLVDTENVVILDSGGKFVPYQASSALDPQKYQGEVLPGGFRLTFFVEFKSIGWKSFTIRAVSMKEATEKGQHLTQVSDKTTKGFSYDKPLLLENELMKASFSPSTGLLESITDSRKKVHSVRLEFKRYETTKSGAYLFWPQGIADLVPQAHKIQHLEGNLYSELRVQLPGLLQHTVRLFKSRSELGQWLEVENTNNLMAENNIEAVLRFSTEIKNDFFFHTDANGFQMVQRRASPDLPPQANYFPATTMAFLQDKTSRLTLHLAESHGVASQDIGQIEVMLDRFLAQDDARGVEEALRDPRTVRTSLRIQLETSGFCRDCLSVTQPTHSATDINLDFNNPIYLLSAGLKPNESVKDDILTKPLSCHTHLVMLKPVTYRANDTRAGLVLHRLGPDCTATTDADCSLTLPSFLNFQNLKTYNETTLNFIKPLKSVKGDVPIKIDPMKLVAVTLTV